MSFYDNAIFWIDVEKVAPNPYQPRREFDEEKLAALAHSIKQYGVLQPLVVTRREIYRDDGGMVVEYELISGERRLRAARLAGILQVPVVIRDREEGDNVKLELAIIENLQREDLNPVDRARAFAQLVSDFGHKHTTIAEKIGKSREYVSNTLRLLQLPEEMLTALAERRISEGHTRPLLMLVDHEEERGTLFKEILLRGLTVRDAEQIAQRIARERVRKSHPALDPSMLELEGEISERLGRPVRIAPRKFGGRMVIDFDSSEDLRDMLARLSDPKFPGDAGSAVEPEQPAPAQAAARAADEEDTYGLESFSI